MHLVTAEAGVTEMVAGTRHTVVAFASNGTHVAVATGDPQVQGGLLGVQTSGGDELWCAAEIPSQVASSNGLAQGP